MIIYTLLLRLVDVFFFTLSHQPLISTLLCHWGSPPPKDFLDMDKFGACHWYHLLGQGIYPHFHYGMIFCSLWLASYWRCCPLTVFCLSEPLIAFSTSLKWSLTRLALIEANSFLFKANLLSNRAQSQISPIPMIMLVSLTTSLSTLEDSTNMSPWVSLGHKSDTIFRTTYFSTFTKWYDIVHFRLKLLCVAFGFT